MNWKYFNLSLYPSTHQSQSNCYPYEHENPDSTFENILVAKKNIPQYYSYIIIEEEKLETYCHCQSDKTNHQCLT